MCFYIINKTSNIKRIYRNFILAIIFIPQISIAQDFILNGDFEDTDSACHASWGIASEKEGLNYDLISCIKPWGAYSNTHLVFYYGGFIKSGNAAASVCLYKANGRSKSYIISQLFSKMERDSSYSIHFICRILSPGLTTNALHVALSDTLLPFNDYAPLNLNYAYKVPLFIPDTNWAEINFIYKASGYEKMIVIGNLSDKKPQIKVSGSKKKYAQIDCLIDQLSITSFYQKRVTQIDSPIQISTKPPYKKNTVYTFLNLLFENNSSHLLPISIKILKPLIIYLQSNISIQIKIIGHTDSIGNGNGNLALSKDRATAVMEELIKFNIEPNRISIEAKGAESPIASNDTEHGRMINRRVEFILK